MLRSHAEEILKRVQAARSEALQAMGDRAVALIRAQMYTGYEKPVVDTGALISDVRWAREEADSVRVGCTLPYARAVHNGTARTAARPFLTDALTLGDAQLKDAAAQCLTEAAT